MKRKYLLPLIAGMLIVSGMLFFTEETSAALHADDITVSGTTIWLNDSQATGGIQVDIDEIWADANVTGAMIWERTADVWLVNYSIVVNASVTFNVAPANGSTWLQLNTNTTNNHSYIEVNGGHLEVTSAMITGWNETEGANNTDWESFRPYIYVHGSTASMNATTADFEYLGYEATNKYGVVLEDIVTRCYFNDSVFHQNYIGLDFANSENQSTLGCNFSFCKDCGIVFTSGSHNGVIDNSLTRTVKVWNTSGQATADGIRITGNNNITIDNTDAWNNTNDGLILSIVSYGNITNSAFYTNGDNGIATDNADHVRITSGTDAYNNTGHGLKLVDGDNLMVSAFHPNDNGGEGVYVDSDSSLNNFTSCHPSFNDDGFYVVGDNNSFTTCNPFNNTGGVIDAGFLITGSTAKNNNFTTCSPYNQKTGFYFSSDANNNTVIGGTIFNHSSFGVYLNTVVYNIIYGATIRDIDTACIKFDDFADWNTVDGCTITGDADTTTYGIYMITTEADYPDNNTINNTDITGTVAKPITNGFYMSRGDYNHIRLVDVSTVTTGFAASMFSHHNDWMNCTVASASSYAFEIIGDCHHNMVDNLTMTGGGDGLYFEDDANNNTVKYSSWSGGSGYGFGCMDDSCYNYFNHCYGNSSSAYSGFDLRNTAHNNIFDYCQAHNNYLNGIWARNTAHNNTLNYCNFSNNDWGIYLEDTTADNIFNNCEIWSTNDAYGIRMFDNASATFISCNIRNGDNYGVKIDDDAVAVFNLCVSYGNTALDWHISDNANVTILTDYILDNIINPQDSASPYGVIVRIPTGSTFALVTRAMQSYTSANTAIIDVHSWTATTYRCWTGTATGATNLIQKVGGLQAGAYYDLVIDGTKWSTVQAKSRTIIISTGVVWFNYSAGWSTHTFEITPHTTTTGGPGGPSGPGVPSVTENTVDVWVVDENGMPIYHVSVYIYSNGILEDSGLTDSNGHYEALLDDGTWRFVGQKTGYDDDEETKAITGDDSVTLTLDRESVWVGDFLGLSMVAWIIVALLLIFGILLSIWMATGAISKEYWVIPLILNVVILVIGIILTSWILIIIGVAFLLVELVIIFNKEISESPWWKT